MKKFTSIILALLLAVSLSACSFGNNGDEQKKVATNFLTEFKNGDYTKAKNYSVSSVDKQLDKIQSSFDTSLSSVYSQAGLAESDVGENFKAKLTTLKSDILKNYMKSYKLNDDYDKDKNTITAKVVIMDESKMTNAMNGLTSKIETMVQTYTNNNLSALQNVYRTGGQKALLSAILEGVADEFYNIMKTDVIDKIETKEETWTITFTKENDKVLVSKLDN